MTSRKYWLKYVVVQQNEASKKASVHGEVSDISRCGYQTQINMQKISSEAWENDVKL